METSSLCQTILIADDNDGTREALISALRHHGYNVTGARNGQEAIEKLATLTAPTLIFMDLMMPVLDGWQVLERMNSNPKFAENKVVTISAVNLSSRLDAKIPMNTVGRLSKPISLKSVLALVEKYCGPGTNVKASALSPTLTNIHP